MSGGYLGRLAGRAAGRPVGARLVPRVDSRAGFAPEADPADAVGDALAVEAIVPRADESDVRRPESGDPAAIAPRAARAAATPQMHAASAPLSAQPQRSTQAPAARPLPAAALRHDSSGAADPIDRPLPAASRGASRPGALPAARAGVRPLASFETRADRTLRSPARPAEHGRDGDARTFDRPQPEANQRSVAIAAPAMHEERAAFDSPGRPRSPLQPAARSEAQAAADAPSVHVEIGRIDVRVAPPPPAPAARPRAAPEGFAGYWRLRNYLDRPR